MLRRPLMSVRAAIAATFALLLLAAPAAAVTPTGTLRTSENADGSFNIHATITWDGCPAVCDWKFMVNVVQDPAACPQRALVNMPEGMAYSPGIPGFPDDGPFTSNGTRTVLMPNIYYPRPPYSYACFAAAGLAERPAGVYSPSEECPDPGSGPYLDQGFGFGAGRCPQIHPIAVVSLPASTRPIRFGPPTPLPPVPARLTLAESRRALRARKIRGETRLRRVAADTVRAVVRNARGTRRYRITETSATLDTPSRIRVRRLPA